MNLGLLFNVLLFLGILTAVNLPAFYIGLKPLERGVPRRLWFELPRFAIYWVWIFLFMLLAVVRHRLQLENEHESGVLLMVLAIVCATYSYYTIGLEKLTGISALKLGLAGNLVIIISTICTGVVVAGYSLYLSYLLYPLVVWAFYLSMVSLGKLNLIKA